MRTLWGILVTIVLSSVVTAKPSAKPDGNALQFCYFVATDRPANAVAKQVRVLFPNVTTLEDRKLMVVTNGAADAAATINRLRKVAGVSKLSPGAVDFFPTAKCQRDRAVFEATLGLYNRQYKRFASAFGIKADEAPRLDYWDSYLWWFKRRGGELSDKRRLAALEAAKDMPSDPTDSGVAVWSYVGVDHISPSQDPTNFGPDPFAGRSNTAIFHPASSSILYAGTAGGGVWKSNNSGSTWTPKSDDWGSLCIGAVAVHPTAVGTVYAGTGDPVGWIFNSDWVYKSTDSGSTWSRLPLPPNAYYSVSDIEICKDDPTVVIVCTNQGSSSRAFRSTNSGASWTQMPVSLVEVDQSPIFFGNRILYGADYGGGVHKSTDEGATWTSIGNADLGKKRLTCSKTDINRVFVANGLAQKVYRFDSGTRTDITANLVTGADTWTQASSYNLFLSAAKAPRTSGDVDVLFLGTLDIYQLTEPAANWIQVSGPAGSPSSRLHTDQHDLKFSETSPYEGLVSCDGGIYRMQFSSTTPGAVTFQGLNTDRGSLQIYGFAVNPLDKWKQLVGAQDNGTSFRSNRLDDWDLVKGGDGTIPIVKRTEPNKMVASSQRMSMNDVGEFAFRRTDDGWATTYVTALGAGVLGEMPFVTETEADPVNSDRLFVGGRGLYRYSFNSDSWTGRLGGFDFGGQISAIGISPVTNARLFVAVGSILYTSSNSGSTWTNIGQGPTPGEITSIAPSSVTSTGCLVTVNTASNSYVYEVSVATTPALWTDRTANLPNVPYYDIVRDPNDPTDGWWIATDIGVYSTANHGTSWANRTAAYGLPYVIVTRLEWAPDQNFLYASTYGRGLWRYGVVAFKEPAIVSSTGLNPSGNLASILTIDSLAYQTHPIQPGFGVRENVVGTCSIMVDTPSPVNDPSLIQVSHRISQSSSYNAVEVQVLNYATGDYEAIDKYSGLTLEATRTSTLSGESLADYISPLRTTRWRFFLKPKSFKRPTSATLSLDYMNTRFDP